MPESTAFYTKIKKENHSRLSFTLTLQWNINTTIKVFSIASTWLTPVKNIFPLMGPSLASQIVCRLVSEPNKLFSLANGIH